MHPFFDEVIAPLLDAARARVVIEVGAERGHTTQRLLAWAAGSGATIHSIDPEPRFDVARAELEHGERLRFHRARSLDVLGGIEGVDAALLDGDHNWYTVISELRLLAAAAARREQPLPLVVAHDAGWPYGRRDLYYDPAAVPAEHRHDAARAGIAPGRSRLGSPGINHWLHNATHEGGPRNGVLTAIEDFTAEHPHPSELVVVEGWHGLAVLAAEPRLVSAPALRAEVERLRSAEFAQGWLAAIERARIAAELRADASARRAADAERRIAALERRLLDEPDPDAPDTLGGG